MTITVYKGTDHAIIEESDLSRFEKAGWSKTKKKLNGGASKEDNSQLYASVKRK